MVPLSFGCGSAVLAAIATLAPSRAARSAIASPMPRLPPDTNSVLPLRDVMGGLQVRDAQKVRDARDDRFPPPLRGRARERGGVIGTARVNPSPQPSPARGEGAHFRSRQHLC